MSGSHRRFCSCVPAWKSPKQLSACTLTPTPTAAQAERPERLAGERVGTLGLVHRRAQLLVGDAARQLDQFGGLPGWHQSRGGHGRSHRRHDP
jgi:hypothetical protein